MHHTCIKNYDLKRMNPKKQYVYQLKEGEDGLLKIEFKGKRAVDQSTEEVRERRKRERDDDGGEREGEVRAEARGDEGRRRQEQPGDQEMVGEESENYISQFYLGQKIDEVLTGDLKRPTPNFNF